MTRSVSLYARELTAIACLIKYGVLHASGRLADSKCEGATHANLADKFVFDCLKAGRMVPHFTVSDSDFSVLIRAPDYNLIVLIYYHNERASHIDALYANIILQLDLTGTFELSKDTSTPNVHYAILGHGSARMPS